MLFFLFFTSSAEGMEFQAERSPLIAISPGDLPATAWSSEIHVFLHVGARPQSPSITGCLSQGDVYIVGVISPQQWTCSGTDVFQDTCLMTLAAGHAQLNRKHP